MNQLQFQEDVLDELQERNPRFHARSYEFVMQALQSVIQSLDEPRHISGRELTEGVRELAIGRYGLLAKSVLEHWGIHGTEDVGHVVFAMVEQGLLVKEDDDTPEDFVDLFDFEEVFETNYPWGSVT
jgi:uncharacterized repeat protein (TIGR04138 family)